MKSLFLLPVYILFAGCATESNNGNPHIVIETGRGNIEIELYAKQAPQTVAAFSQVYRFGLFQQSRILPHFNRR